LAEKVELGSGGSEVFFTAAFINHPSPLFSSQCQSNLNYSPFVSTQSSFVPNTRTDCRAPLPFLIPIPNSPFLFSPAQFMPVIPPQIHQLSITLPAQGTELVLISLSHSQQRSAIYVRAEDLLRLRSFIRPITKFLGKEQTTFSFDD